MQISQKISLFLLLTLTGVFAAACGDSGSVGGPNGVDPNATAATVNGKAITMEEVERAVKQQAQGQEGRLSQLELAGARLQVLQSLIEQEVMYQKAESEQALPTDDEVTTEYNKRKTASGLSQEQWDAKMKEVGETEASAKLAIRKALAIQKLTDKITGKIDAPKDSEIEQFFNSNRESFKNKRGAQLAAIVVDPRDLGEGDPTKNDIEAQAKAREIGARLLSGADFATVARENSEDPDTRLRGGDWRYFTEDEMKQVFPQGFAEAVMQLNSGDIVRQLIPFEGRYLILKVQRKQEQDEDRNLDSPNVRQEITEYLTNARKQLLAASYQAMAMNQARIENNLAKRVVDNPNELSGARPAQPANANTNANGSNANAAQANSTSNLNANSGTAGNSASNANSGTSGNSANANK